jgi:hypothetical protein
MSLLSMLVMSATSHAEPMIRPVIPGRDGQIESAIVGTFYELQGEIVYRGIGDSPFATPPEVVAVMVDNVRVKRVVQVVPSAENELRMIYERPRAVQVIAADEAVEPPKDIIAIIGQSKDDPIAYVTSPRSGVRGLVLSTPDTDVEVLDVPPPGAEPQLIPDEDTVLGILVPGQQGSLNAFMQVLDPVEMTALLELHQIGQDTGWPRLQD